jgi:hypothetical protein
MAPSDKPSASLLSDHDASASNCEDEKYSVNCASPEFREFCDHDSSILNEAFPRNVCAHVAAIKFILGKDDYCGRCKPPEDLVVNVYYPSEVPSSIPSSDEHILFSPSGSSFPSTQPSEDPKTKISSTPPESWLPSGVPSEIPSGVPSEIPSATSSIPSLEPNFSTNNVNSFVPSIFNNSFSILSTNNQNDTNLSKFEYENVTAFYNLSMVATTGAFSESQIDLLGNNHQFLEFSMAFR